MRQVTDGSNYKHGATGPRTKDHFGAEGKSGGFGGAAAGDIDGQSAVSVRGKRAVEQKHGVSGGGPFVPGGPDEELPKESKEIERKEKAAGIE